MAARARGVGPYRAARRDHAAHQPLGKPDRPRKGCGYPDQLSLRVAQPRRARPGGRWKLDDHRPAFQNGHEN